MKPFADGGEDEGRNSVVLRCCIPTKVIERAKPMWAFTEADKPRGSCKKRSMGHGCCAGARKADPFPAQTWEKTRTKFPDGSSDSHFRAIYAMHKVYCTGKKLLSWAALPCRLAVGLGDPPGSKVSHTLVPPSWLAGKTPDSVHKGGRGLQPQSQPRPTGVCQCLKYPFRPPKAALLAL
jgi:hypothetical protein